MLARYRCPWLARLDRATGRVIRRYERERSGKLVHVDIKKLGNIPDGGGWQVTGKGHGGRNARASTTARRGNHPVIGACCFALSWAAERGEWSWRGLPRWRCR